MAIYTVEVLTDEGWELVLATDNLQKAYEVNYFDYGGFSGNISRWENSEKIFVDKL